MYNSDKSQVSFSDALFNCATECALRRQKKQCTANFGGFACHDCKYYINNYVDADPRHTRLFMNEAEAYAQTLRRTGKHSRIGIVLLSLIMLTVGLLFAQSVFGNMIRNVLSKQSIYSSPSLPTAQLAYRPGKSEYAQKIMHINNAYATVYHVLRNDIDLDGDGKMDCKDASLAFVIGYTGNPNDVTLVTNHNGAFKHMFVAVTIYNKLLFLEPQSRFRGYLEDDLEHIWGEWYDPSFNDPWDDQFTKEKIRKAREIYSLH